MPFIDKSTLTYPATNAFPVRKWLDVRDPLSSDFKSFKIFDLWVNEVGETAWIMVGRGATSGTWLQMATSGTGILTITGDIGGAVGPDGGNNIDIISGDGVTVTGSPGANSLTIDIDGDVATKYDTDSGIAAPSGGILNINGTGGIVTSGAGDTVNIDTAGIVATSIVTDAGTAIPAANILNVLGGTGSTTAGAGDTVTISADDTVATSYTCDSGSAIPSANNLSIRGAGSTTTSGAGDVVTVSSSGGGLSWNEITVVGPTQMTIDMGFVTNNGSTVELTLPLTSPFGSVIEIVGKGAGGWQVNQNAGQQIFIGSSSTTIGVTGKLNSSAFGDSLSMVCITTDTEWRIINSTGNLITT